MADLRGIEDSIFRAQPSSLPSAIYVYESPLTLLSVVVGVYICNDADNEIEISTKDASGAAYKISVVSIPP